jgi:hypothetical protein
VDDPTLPSLPMQCFMTNPNKIYYVKINDFDYYWNCRIEQKMEISKKKHNLMRSNDLYIYF